MDAFTEFFTGLRQDLLAIKKDVAEIRQRQLETSSNQRFTPKYRGIDWLCSITGWAKQTAYQNVNAGKVEGVHKVGKNLLFDEEAVLSWIASNKLNTAQSAIESAELAFSQRHTNSNRQGGRRQAS